MRHLSCNVAQRGDALELLRSLAEHCTALVFFDPQHRDDLDKLQYGNEGGRQRERCKLPQMSSDYIEQCCRESARVLRPSGYLMLWKNAFGVCEGWHQRLADVLKCVDLIARDNGRIGNGYRARRRGDHIVVLQKAPLKARATWRTMPSIPDRWIEKVDRKLHPHIKPIGLISALIEAITSPNDLVVDPAAGSFVVKHAARKLGREFIGCDIAHAGELKSPQTMFDEILRGYCDAQSRILANRESPPPDGFPADNEETKQSVMNWQRVRATKSTASTVTPPSVKVPSV
jgi:site-specific DNA-methyltransferase (adenine-specific)